MCKEKINSTASYAIIEEMSVCLRNQTATNDKYMLSNNQLNHICDITVYLIELIKPHI